MNEKKRQLRRQRIRARVRGTADRPRAVVVRSNRAIGVQLINDDLGTTLVQVQSRLFDEKGSSKVDQARLVGTTVSAQAKEKGIDRAVFDRNGYRYHGRVKALADGMREGGLDL